MLRFLIYIFALLALGSCRKNDNAYVQGTVKDDFTGEVVAGAEVQVFKRVQAPAPDVIVATGSSDDEGKYKINYHKQLNKEYYVSGKHPGYLNIVNPFGIEKKKDNKDIRLLAVGFVQLKILKRDGSSNYVVVELPYPNQPVTININSTDTLLPQLYPVSATRQTKVTWTIMPSMKQSYDLFFVDKGTTRVFTIYVD
jgi:hypothetical protein